MDYYFSRRVPSQILYANKYDLSGQTHYYEVDPASQNASRTPLTQNSWVNKVMAQSGSEPILIFVHGYNVSPANFFKKYRAIKTYTAEQGFRGTVIGYDWPCKMGFSYEHSRVKACAPYLVADGISQLLKKDSGKDIHILAHSMGTYLTSNCLYGSYAANYPLGRANQVMLVAADMDDYSMRGGAWGALALDNQTTRLTSYHSNRDRVLDVPKNPFDPGSFRVGWSGLPATAPAKLRDVSCTAHCDTYFPGHTNSINLSHNFYFSSRTFYRDVVETMAGLAHGSVSTRTTHGSGAQSLNV